MPSAYLLLDVDGVLNKLSREPGAGFCAYEADGFTVNLCDWHAPALMKLAAEHDAEIVWATMWEQRANECISHLVGLPNDLRFIDMSCLSWLGFGKSFKVPAINKWLVDNNVTEPVVWFDDDVYEDAFDWASERTERGMFTYVSKCDHAFGLSNRALQRADRFLRNALRGAVEDEASA